MTVSNTNQTRFTWNAVTGASSYRLWATNYTAKTSLDLRGLTNTHYSTSLALGDWFFVAIASNNVGCSLDSIPLRFSIPLKISPQTFE
jgi:hypothetical protein